MTGQKLNVKDGNHNTGNDLAAIFGWGSVNDLFDAARKKREYDAYRERMGHADGDMNLSSDEDEDEKGQGNGQGQEEDEQGEGEGEGGGGVKKKGVPWLYVGAGEYVREGSAEHILLEEKKAAHEKAVEDARVAKEAAKKKAKAEALEAQKEGKKKAAAEDSWSDSDSDSDW